MGVIFLTCPDVFSGAGHLYFIASPVASHSCTHAHKAATQVARNRKSQV